MIALLTMIACGPQLYQSEDLEVVFDDAAAEFGVPRDLLVSVAYTVSRMDGRAGAPSKDGGVGVMNLHIDGRTPSIDAAAETVGLDADTIRYDMVANVRGGAAVLAGLAKQYESRTGEEVDTMAEWVPVVAAWAGVDDPLVAEGFAYQVFSMMAQGFIAETPEGRWIEVAPHDFEWIGDRMAMSGSGLISQYVPASSANYSDSSRGVTDIDTVVIHTVQGSYSGCISWFGNSDASASAHYVVRSSDGEITQMVDEEDIAWHAGDWDTNSRSVGIEHEGYVDSPETWYTDSMYRSSATLVRDIADRNGIPLDRDHIIAHAEVPGCSSSSGGGASCHTDPGSGWDWDYFMDMVYDAGPSGISAPAGIADGSKTGRFDVEVTSGRYGVTDHCSGTLSGSATGGSLYVTSTCLLSSHGDRVGEIPLSIAATATSDADFVGRLAAEGYADEFSGAINADGSLQASWEATHDLGGDIGQLTYRMNVTVEP